jgi:hypothetical protein
MNFYEDNNIFLDYLLRDEEPDEELLPEDDPDDDDLDDDPEEPEEYELRLPEPDDPLPEEDLLYEPEE